MALSAAALRDRFVSDGVAVASPPKLLVALHDRLLLDLRHSAVALQEGDREAAHHKLIHAQKIVTTLHSSLDIDVWPEGVKLQSLYCYLLTQMVEANVEADAARAETCYQLIKPLRDAWAQAMMSLASSPVAASTSGSGFTA